MKETNHRNHLRLLNLIISFFLFLLIACQIKDSEIITISNFEFEVPSKKIIVNSLDGSHNPINSKIFYDKIPIGDVQYICDLFKSDSLIINPINKDTSIIGNYILKKKLIIDSSMFYDLIVYYSEKYDELSFLYFYNEINDLEINECENMNRNIVIWFKYSNLHYNKTKLNYDNLIDIFSNPLKVSKKFKNPNNCCQISTPPTTSLIFLENSI